MDRKNSHRIKSKHSDIFSESRKEQLDNMLSTLDEVRLFDEENAWKHIRAKAEFQDARQLVFTRTFLRYAAAVILLLVAGYFGFDALFPHNEFMNRGTQGVCVALNDHSEVILAPGAMISTSRFFGRSNRVLELRGTAYFNVRKDAEKTFKIRTEGHEIRVLGTRFYVDPNQKGGDLNIRLLEGSLQCSSKGVKEAMPLTEGNQLFIEAGHAERAPLETNLTPVWMPGEIVLDDVSVAEAVRKINEALGREVLLLNVDDQADDCRIRTIVRAGELEQFLNEMTLLFNVKIRSYKGSFAIDEINCNS